jgi:hypothetical protein
MPSTYLYLSPKNRITDPAGRAVWIDLPKLSLTSRQCYLSIAQMGFMINANTAETQGNRFIVKMNIASDNYYSSDNEGVVVCALEPTRVINPRPIYQLSNESGDPIEILTNDNYTRLEFTILDAFGNFFPVAAPAAFPAFSDTIDIILKFDYPEVEEIQKTYVATMPKNLL